MKHHWLYLKYVVKHKWLVLRAGIMIGAPIWRLIIHDWSKFLPSEWVPYARYFYVEPWTEEEILRGSRICCTDFYKLGNQYAEDTFNIAWNLHQKRNKHHWQFWILTNDNSDPKHQPLQIPDKYVLEMVADWIGAGWAITGRIDVGNWYLKNRNNIILHPETRSLVEKTLCDLVYQDFKV